MSKILEVRIKDLKNKDEIIAWLDKALEYSMKKHEKDIREFVSSQIWKHR